MSVDKTRLIEKFSDVLKTLDEKSLMKLEACVDTLQLMNDKKESAISENADSKVS